MNKNLSTLLFVSFLASFILAEPSPAMPRKSQQSSEHRASTSTKGKKVASASHGERRFMGYHGTSKEGYAVLKNKMKGFTSRMENELGPGLYTTGDLKTAQHFAKGAGGADGVVVKVYATGFSKMVGDAPNVPWIKGVWSKPENQGYLINKDFLWAKHRVLLPKGMEMRDSQQIKFNPRAYHKLSFELHDGSDD